MLFFKNRWTSTTTIDDRYGKREETVVNVNRVVKDAAWAIGALVVFLLCWPFYTVPTGSRGVLTQFGRIIRIEPEGLAIIPPWQKITLFSIRAEQADIEKAPGATLDLQPVDTSLTVRYNIDPERVNEVFEQYSHTGDLSSYVQSATMETFKAVTAKYTAVDLIAKREAVRNDVVALLQTKLTVYGARVITVDMRNFDFDSKDFMSAINSKVTQEQKLLAAQNQLKTVESEQQQKVAVATAEATALKARADGEAYSIQATANANAKAQLALATSNAEGTRLMNDVLAKSKDALEMRRIEVELAARQKWDGKLPEAYYASAPLPFINTGNVPVKLETK